MDIQLEGKTGREGRKGRSTSPLPRWLVGLGILGIGLCSAPGSHERIIVKI